MPLSNAVRPPPARRLAPYWRDPRAKTYSGLSNATYSRTTYEKDRNRARDERYGRPGRNQTLHRTCPSLVGLRGQLSAIASAQPRSTGLYSSTPGRPFLSQRFFAAAVRRAELTRYWLRRRSDRRADGSAGVYRGRGCRGSPR